MAVTIMPARPRTRQRAWQLVRCALLTLVAAAGCLLASTPAARWAGLALVPVAIWVCILSLRSSTRTRDRHLVGARLARLPDDFYLLHDLAIPAPWGETQIDQVIISRFGLVVIGAGASSSRMAERVEAIRTVLFTYGIADPSIPVRPLIILPPGALPPRRPEFGVLTLRIEHLRLQHLAPSAEAHLTDEQVSTIAQCLLQARAAS